jgi:hypothetical protein
MADLCAAAAAGAAAGLARPLPQGVALAKLGLAGCARRPDWPRRWADTLAALAPGAAPVAVVYADWQAAEAPPPDDVLRHARALACAALLLDTFDKHGGGLLQRLSLGDVARLIDQAHAAGMLAVVGGSLDEGTIPAVRALRPDYVAVRGAACRGGRSGPIDEDRVRALVGLLGGSRLAGGDRLGRT